MRSCVSHPHILTALLNRENRLAPKISKSSNVAKAKYCGLSSRSASTLSGTDTVVYEWVKDCHQKREPQSNQSLGFKRDDAIIYAARWTDLGSHLLQEL